MRVDEGRMAVGGLGEFDGLVSVVTGGASGIGLATAKELAARGSRVAVLDLDVATLPATIRGEVADVSETRSVERAMSAVGEHFGRVDILVNNAGIGAVGTIEAFAEEEWRRVLDVNVLGIVRVTAAALPWLRRSPAAAIVNTCSIAARIGLPDRALYSASKGAVLALTQAMAADHVREGIRVNCVNPGTASTPWVDRLLARAEDPEAERSALDQRQPIGRLVTAEEVARAIVYAASPLSASTVGTAIDVDGGATTLRLRPER